ncbi:hypothetical protein FLAVO9AF_130176 [Flavobacterium sp. 9AF]|uniref:hypothetical protein n=1 Tax=Flavobacterium sp. 9AF TaxID=2653142 RepID=UPI0012F0C9CD|nr:hypothetical protein [Flavobacterium sp. 9AF]VXB31334.1 hypothetical protein FLAVO9AF_130176 [Flavobacterium sp. 9AF]
MLYFTSCINDDFIENQNSQNENKISSRYINFNEVKRNWKIFDKFKNVQEKINQSKSNSLNQNARLVYLSQFDFSIDTDQILLIEKEGYKSYTFPIYRENEIDKTENLVITESNGFVNAYISKYDLTENDKASLENNQYVDLKSKTEISSLEERSSGEPCYELVNIPVEWNEQGQVTVSMVFAVEVDCPDGGGSSGGGGGSDDGGDTGGGSSGGWTGGWTDGGWYGGGTGSGNTGGSDGGWYGGGGSTGDGGSAGGSTGGSTSGGNTGDPLNQDPSLTDSDGNPIITSPVLSEPRDRHVKALNKLTANNSDGTKTIVKQKIDDLKSRLTTEYKEMGYHFIKDGASFLVREPTWRGDNQVVYDNGDQLLVNTKVVLHMHQNEAHITKGVNPQTGLPNIVVEELVPIWSDGDIDKTAEQFGDLNNDEDFTSILVTQAGTFALRVGNSSELNETNLILGNDANEKEKFNDNFNEQVLKPCNGGSNSCYVEKFIVFINTYMINGHSIGLVLYQAVYDNQDNITNWVKL